MMSAKIRVHGRPQSNTKRKLRRFRETVDQERQEYEKPVWDPPPRILRHGAKVDDAMRGTDDTR